MPLRWRCCCTRSLDVRSQVCFDDLGSSSEIVCGDPGNIVVLGGKLSIGEVVILGGGSLRTVRASPGSLVVVHNIIGFVARR